MWVAIAAESNRYQLQTLQQVMKELNSFKSIKPHELVNFIGLLCARTLCPHKEKLAKHWSVDAQGAVRKGTFGKYMPRKRFEEIVRFLHFSNNNSADAKKLKTWKIKPVADTNNRMFKLGMTVGRRIAFDEGMILMRSKFNPMHQYLRGKPHPWGTKCFLTCDADSGYCYRVGIYQG
ncbi:hypothetical protein PI124_g10661 [Phytophthora idaei]|nr:hypothetical protein PI124_g10661 [Phytophthora idaei]